MSYRVELLVPSQHGLVSIMYPLSISPQTRINFSLGFLCSQSSVLGKTGTDPPPTLGRFHALWLRVVQQVRRLVRCGVTLHVGLRCDTGAHRASQWKVRVSDRRVPIYFSILYRFHGLSPQISRLSLISTEVHGFFIYPDGSTRVFHTGSSTRFLIPPRP